MVGRYVSKEIGARPVKLGCWCRGGCGGGTEGGVGRAGPQLLWWAVEDLPASSAAVVDGSGARLCWTDLMDTDVVDV